jgi:aquaporin related protein
MVQPGIATRYTEDSTRPGEKRLAGFGWLPNRARHLLIAFIGEFVGTFLFLFFAFAATQVANNLLAGRSMDIQTLMYISLAFGFSLAVNVWVFFRISGGLFNPAVSALWTHHRTPIREFDADLAGLGHCCNGPHWCNGLGKRCPAHLRADL